MKYDEIKKLIEEYRKELWAYEKYGFCCYHFSSLDDNLVLEFFWNRIDNLRIISNFIENHKEMNPVLLPGSHDNSEEPQIMLKFIYKKNNNI